MKFLVCIIMLLCHCKLYCQTYAFTNGNWWHQQKFVKKIVYTSNGVFTFKKPTLIDSVIDLQNKYCIPPFADAHTHNLDGNYGLVPMVKQYITQGVYYVQVTGNYGTGAQQARVSLQKLNLIDAVYANGLLTATYGHGFYPYEPLAMGFYNPKDQMKYVDSVKKSRRAENDAYYFLDDTTDVNTKWPLILKYKPDIIKICLLDAADYEAKRRAEQVETYGLSAKVAAHVVQKAHAQGLRVIAHVETADDARLCANIGVDALAHMPGYAWNGTEETRKKFCMTKDDVRLFKQKGMSITPTLNLDYTATFDSSGKKTEYPKNFAKTVIYEKQAMQWLYKAQVPLCIGGDYYGKTAEVEIDYVIKHNIFTPQQLLHIYCRITAQQIFPNRKIGLLQEGYEASFLILNNNPLLKIEEIKNIQHRIRKGVYITIP
jgi:imidazolonepropionase-like amidohydrolase